MKRLLAYFIFLFLALFLITKPAAAQGSVQGTSQSFGCEFSTIAAKVADLYALRPATEALEFVREMQTIKTKACRGEYSFDDDIVYANGTIATTAAGDNSASWYWPNGFLITSTPGNPTASVYYPNGNTVTSSLRTVGATYNYGTGQTITADAGVRGEDITGINGPALTTNAPEFVAKGQLDVEAFLTYVVNLNLNLPASTSGLNQCSPGQVTDAINRTIGLVETDQSALAVNQLRNIKTCL